MYLQETKIKYLIIIGDYISEISRKVEKNKEDNTIEAAKFLKYIRKLDEKTLEEISEELNLSNESDALVIPYMMIFKCMAESIGAESLWAPGTNVSDGIAFHYAQKNNMIRVEHDFEADVLSAARNLSERYMSYTPHIDALTQMATLIFDTDEKSTWTWQKRTGCFCRWLPFYMTAENISVLPTVRPAPMTLLWLPRLSD